MFEKRAKVIEEIIFNKKFMQWEDILKEVLIFFTGTSIFVSALIILSKYLIKHLLSKDLEKFKADISLELEKYRSQLEKENIKHRIRFSRLHTDRAEIIRDIYSKIYSTEVAIIGFVASLNKDDFREKGRVMAEKYKEYAENYKKNKIFFNKNQCQLMMDIDITFRKFWPTGLKEKPMDDRKDFWVKEKPTILKQIGILKVKLEDDFREMLGVDF